MNLTRFSHARLKVTESFAVSPNHSWLCGIVVMTPDWESVGFEFKYRNFCVLKERLGLISLILNLKWNVYVEVSLKTSFSSDHDLGIYRSFYPLTPVLLLTSWKSDPDCGFGRPTYPVTPPTGLLIEWRHLMEGNQVVNASVCDFHNLPTSLRPLYRVALHSEPPSLYLPILR